MLNCVAVIKYYLLVLPKVLNLQRNFFSYFQGGGGNSQLYTRLQEKEDRDFQNAAPGVKPVFGMT